jgi:hypothetical protein
MGGLGFFGAGLLRAKVNSFRLGYSQAAIPQSNSACCQRKEPTCQANSLDCHSSVAEPKLLRCREKTP